ncbi:MAG: hypothetical protein PX483_20250 [Nostocales cyanobacterium LE14-WE4]|jgi:hypothetical protein|nr:hypothetical protein [Anabaena sp. 49633_E8]MCE2701994.1 hypothetical protein [Anabaena sp. 49633_E8]MDJ0503134.1 hypothetical protein [Nostocales cyanobacterium LE14-WE4]
MLRPYSGSWSLGAKHLEDKLSVIAKNSSPNASPVQWFVVRGLWFVVRGNKELAIDNRQLTTDNRQLTTDNRQNYAPCFH